MNKDYYAYDRYQSPRRPDSGARLFVVGIVIMLLVIGGLLLWG